MAKALVAGVVQLSSQQDVGSNLARMRARALEASERGAELIVLPENFAYMGDDDGKAGLAEDLDAADGPIARALLGVARDSGAWIVAGGLPERAADPARPYNTCAVYDPRGVIRFRYRKMHLFDVDLADGTRYRESSSTTGGDTPVVAPAAGLNVGLSICYDLRFPELYRALSDRGADVLVVPAAFTLATGKDHWTVLLRARAIESQCWVLAAAQWGNHPGGRQTFGSSCIVDPWGCVVAQVSEGEGVATARLDLAYLERIRQSLPALRHRRL